MTYSLPLRRLPLLACTLLFLLLELGIGSEAQAQNQGCFSFNPSAIECVRTPNSTSYHYRFSFRFRNRSGMPASSFFVTANSPGGITLSPASFTFSPAIAAGATDSNVRSFTISGSGATAGTVVRMTGRMVTTAGVACTDTFSVTLPNCVQQLDNCLDIVEQEIGCRMTANGPQWTWCFNVRNRASNSKTFISLTSSLGVTTDFNLSPVAPGGLSSRLCVPISGSTAGSLITYTIRFCHDTVIGRDTVRRRVCCEDTATIRLPQCQSTPAGCLSILESRVECRDSSANGTTGGYLWCFNVRNNSNFTATRFYVGSVGYTLSPALAPGAVSNRICVPINGSPGTRLGLTIRLCRDSLIRVRDTVIREEICCSDTTSILLPYCNTPSQGCLELVEQRVECSRDSSGASSYLWCFNVRNKSGFRAASVTVMPSDPSISVSPGNITLSPEVVPGGLSSRLCVNISGGRPGQSVSFVIMMCDASGERCCFDTVTVKLPECNTPIEDCCSRFKKSFIYLTNSASSNGATSLWGYLSAGPNAIKSVSATLVESRINGQPVAGYFTNGFIRVTAGSVPYMHEFVWTSSPAANLNAPTLFNWRLRFPAMSANARTDTVRYCIRVRFTDVNCVTCDTVLCFTRIRYRFIGGPNGGGTLKDGEKDGDRIQSGGPTLGGALYSNDSGAIQIVFPAAPPELGAIRYVGLQVRADGVPVTGIGTMQPGYAFGAMGGVGEGRFNVAPGAALDLGLRYGGLGARPTLGHTLAFRYVQQSNPTDTLEEEVDMMLRRADLNGGDKLRPEVVDGFQIRTYALHLDNANPGKEPIHRLVITTNGSVRIVAVGPTSNPSRAVLEFAKGNNDSATQRYVGEVIGGESIMIAPGSTHGPIYLTLDGIDIEEDAAPVHFRTLNAYGQVVTEGEMVLSNTSSMREAETGGTTGIMMAGSYPNPATGSATIEFVLPRHESVVTLVVTDLAGREVARLIDRQDLAAGQHAVYFNTAGLPSGSYLYTVRAGSQSVTKTMQIAR